jgi:hypothetical protein
VIGYVIWAFLFAAMLVVEGLGLTLRGHEWPTVSDLFRTATRPVIGRWIFFALWLWVGWHFFIRGWEFFLRGPGAHAPSGSGGKKGFFATITQVVIPLLVLFTVFFTVGAASRKSIAYDEHVPAHAAPRVEWARFLHYAIVTSVAGYGLFIALMGLYQLVTGSSGIFISAVQYGAFLTFVIALPLFALIALARSKLRRMRSG